MNPTPAGLLSSGLKAMGLCGGADAILAGGSWHAVSAVPGCNIWASKPPSL